MVSSASPPTASIPQQKTNKCNCKLAGMFLCSLSRKFQKIRKTKRFLFILCLPLARIQPGKSLWEIIRPWFRGNSFVLMCFISQLLRFPSIITVILLPVLGSRDISRESYSTSCLLMTPKSWYVLQRSFALLCFPPGDTTFSHHCPLFKVKGKMHSVLTVIGLWLCFLQRRQFVEACNQAASFELWCPLPGLW